MEIQYKNKIKIMPYHYISVFLVFFYSLFLFSFPALAVSPAVTNAMEGAKKTADKAYVSGYSDDIVGTIGKIVGVALSFVGVLFFLLFVYAGVMWMTARGNEQDVTKAKDLMQSAIIGLIIVLSAYAITTYITTQLGVK